MNRLTHLPTLRIRPDEKIAITYGGKTYEGVGGDTVATALYANGIRTFARSLKYHRPRGLYSVDGECSNTLMNVDGQPNVNTENTPAANGMVVSAQNVAGKTAAMDPMAFMNGLSWAMPAGFYYQSLHKPAAVWPQAIKKIRKAAGLGVLKPDFKIKGNYDEIYPTADICVIGGGAAGMSAALAAAEKGLRVILLENRPWLGGSFEYRPATDADGTPLYQRARDLTQQVLEAANIRVFPHTAMVGAYNNNLITAFQRGATADSFDQRYVEIRAASVVVASGCIERPLLFANNERPGVMQIACAHRLARTWGILPGTAAVFSVGHDLGLEAALDLFDLGVQVACVADVREDGQDRELVAALAEREIPLFRGWVAGDTHGAKAIKAVTLTTLTGMRQRKIECDLLVASAGLTPVTGPLSLSGAKLGFDRRTGYFLPDRIPAGIHAAGRLLGLDDSRAIEVSGRLAGLRAAVDCGLDLKSDLQGAMDQLAALPGTTRGSKFVAAPAKDGKVFVCFDEDTTIKNVDQAMAKGFDVPELIKRFTSAGTGPGQGGIPGHNLALYVAQTQESPDADPRPTTVRAPLVPTLMATYAGSNHDMCKHTPLHDSQVAAGGCMERIGVWTRARRFSDDTTARDEIEAVRNGVAMLDASTLGKFRIHGPDALKALERVYIGNMARMDPGRIKYAAMCNDDGCIIDDGVVIKRAENDYYFTTSTGRAGQTVEWIRYHTRYDGWNFHLVNLTDAFGVINLAGPSARKVMEQITDADVSNEAFPFAGYREFIVGGEIPVRVMRLGFVGELSYELHAPASYMQSLWELLQTAGKAFDISIFGLEAQSTLRLEKGHLIIGSESEQRTSLLDLGLGFLWYRHKPEAKTVGAVALAQSEHQSGRLKLVGIRMADPASPAPKDGSPVVDTRVRGYVCTARYSYSLQEPVGMALLEASLSEADTPLSIYEDDCNGVLLEAKVASMPFYDPKGGRMRM